MGQQATCTYALSHALIITQPIKLHCLLTPSSCCTTHPSSPPSIAAVSGANLAKFGVDPLPSSEKAVQAFAVMLFMWVESWTRNAVLLPASLSCAAFVALLVLFPCFDPGSVCHVLAEVMTQRANGCRSINCLSTDIDTHTSLVSIPCSLTRIPPSHPRLYYLLPAGRTPPSRPL